MIKTFSLVLDLLKVYLSVKLESSILQDLLCKSAWLNRSKIRLNRSNLMQNVFFAEFSNLSQDCMTCRVLCFALSIKRKTLVTFWGCCLYCVYESLVRSRGVCLHTYLGFPISRLMSRAWWSFQLLHKELKEKHKWEYLWLLWIQERSSSWTRSCHVVVVVSFLLEVAIGC